ncbi:hypothetical protein [Paenibacillus sp. PAMC21692]|uniref:hypothetical protein n=1 Tax=Paenibacillus sp. PAMC21692 TaxID=2762320 RepID=UPI00164DBE0B|nr:hypothetical protein [Paenibacillus sp. PAMC21692]QNK56640.1 hypothetical protein H7F31_29595 [Paenibacillus sp. PAMC21692]
MLDETARKLFRMFYALYRFEAAHIDMDRLARLTGRSKLRIATAIRALEEKQYITWNERAGAIRVMTPAERNLKEAN